MSDEFDPGQSLESEADADSLFAPNPDHQFPRSFPEKILDMLDPFEALGAILEEPGFGLALLMVVAAVVATALLVGGLWVAVQEAFLSGGPPQGLGLK